MLAACSQCDAVQHPEELSSKARHRANDVLRGAGTRGESQCRVMRPCVRIFHWTMAQQMGRLHPSMEVVIVADDRSKTTQDGKLIALKEPHEVAYWTKALGVSKEELTKLVEKHGHSAAKVREALAKK